MTKKQNKTGCFWLAGFHIEKRVVGFVYVKEGYFCYKKLRYGKAFLRYSREVVVEYTTM